MFFFLEEKKTQESYAGLFSNSHKSIIKQVEFQPNLF